MYKSREQLLSQSQKDTEANHSAIQNPASLLHLAIDPQCILPYVKVERQQSSIPENLWQLLQKNRISTDSSHNTRGGLHFYAPFLSWLPSLKLLLSEDMKCATCKCAKGHRGTKKSAIVTPNKCHTGTLKIDDLQPGIKVSVDHFKSSLWRCAFDTYRKELSDTLHDGCIFVDHSTWYPHV